MVHALPVGECVLHQLLCHIQAGLSLPHLLFEQLQIPRGGYIIVCVDGWVKMSMLTSKPGLLCWSGGIWPRVPVEVLATVVNKPLPGMLSKVQQYERVITTPNSITS